METFDYRKHTQDKVLEALNNARPQDPDWIQSITRLDYSIVIWYLKELIEKKENAKYIDAIFELAKFYSNDVNPSTDEDNLNQKISQGEEVRNIYTVRGTVPWLLTSIAATFRTDLYSEIISIVERLAFDPVYYVRIQATVPLVFFAQNIRARQHPDHSPFNFEDSDRQRVIDLSFRMLEAHRDMPRVLEGVSNIFNALRMLSEVQAKQVISSLFYNSKAELQPDYLTHQGVPLLIFFAEYRSDVGTDFNGGWFQEFAFELLRKSEADAPYVRSTFLWHTWKEIQNDQKNYIRLKKYIPLFLHEEFELQSLHQYEFLVKEVIKISPEDGAALFQRQLDFVMTWAHLYDIRAHSPWLLDTREIIETIAVKFPDKYVGILSKITEIVLKGVYVGDLSAIFQAYLLIPQEEKRLAVRQEILPFYEQVKRLDSIGKLPTEL